MLTFEVASTFDVDFRGGVDFRQGEALMARKRELLSMKKNYHHHEVPRQSVVWGGVRWGQRLSRKEPGLTELLSKMVRPVSVYSRLD